MALDYKTLSLMCSQENANPKVQLHIHLEAKVKSEDMGVAYSPAGYVILAYQFGAHNNLNYVVNLKVCPFCTTNVPPLLFPSLTNI